ncbi:MAG: hypothetical protein ACXWTU_00730, partial [Methylotenera sp.]
IRTRRICPKPRVIKPCRNQLYLPLKVPIMETLIAAMLTAAIQAEAMPTLAIKTEVAAEVAKA